MSNPMMWKYPVLAVAVLSLISGFAQQDLFAKQKNGQAGNSGKIEEYYRGKNQPHGELYRQAQQENEENTNHVVVRFIPDRNVLAPNLRHLSRHSTDIIIGRILENRSYLNSEGDEIHKLLTVFVQQVFKGGVANASRITIRQLGGTWLYDDGLAVTWMPVGEAVPSDGKSFVFFLRDDEDSENANGYIPTLGAQGVFELDFEQDAVVPTDLNMRDPVFRKYKNVPMTDFFEEIESVVDEEISGF